MFKRSIKKTNSALTNSRAYHSRFYHSYFEDYAEYEFTKKNGKTGIQRIYVGDWYSPALSSGELRAVLLSYIVLFITSGISFFYSFLQPVISNTIWYIVLPEACSLFFLGWTFLSLIEYLIRDEKFTIHTYKVSSLSLKKSCLGNSICCLIVSAGTIIHAFFSSSITQELFCAVLFLLSSACFFSINRIESFISYKTQKSTTEVSDSAVKID